MTLLLTLDDGSVQRKLADAVEFARAAVLEDAPEEQLGDHVGVTREDAVTASHLFEAQVPGYGGWRWSVTVALAGDDEPVTVSEVVLVPGPAALVAPAWVPWERRVRAGDLGVGDIFPTAENDPRLVPAYLQSDDPAVEETAREVGLGRVHTLSRFGRTEAAARWHEGEFGPRSDMARSAPDVCGTCGFFVPLAGSLRGVFGVCSNDIAPADGHVVDVEYGCGAHSEVEVEVTSSVPVAELVYDDSLLDFAPAPAPEVVETAAAEPETGIAESDVSPAEVEPEVAAEPVAAAVEPVAPEVAEPVASEQAESAAAQAAPVPAAADEVAEPADPVATEPVEPAVVPEPAASELADSVPAAEPAAAEPEAADSAATVAEAPADGVAEPAAEAPVATGGEVTEPGEAAEASVASEAAGPAGEPAGRVAEPAVSDEAADPAGEPAVGVAEPAVSDEAAEPVGVPAVAGEPVVAEVPEPAEAEPTQAEVTDATELRAAPEAPEATTEHAADEIPAAAESDAAEVDPVPSEVAEPLSAGSEGEAGEPAEAAAPGPGGEAQDSEVPAAVLNDDVVTEASPADEAQAQVDDSRDR
ncbi:DUF3027 domain-containing protein [Amycolatopsis kentuckyensis]|uniref:DUF3027 domain-containing protein n=1 Tax=Amycolatopsis kentuckyensis TaxID=218823 RepID=UPI000A3BFE62|nr:DUF3027 domain-containing protein [Amycolatopsis kentuckyensis]